MQDVQTCTHEFIVVHIFAYEVRQHVHNYCALNLVGYRISNQLMSELNLRRMKWLHSDSVHPQRISLTSLSPIFCVSSSRSLPSSCTRSAREGAVCIRSTMLGIGDVAFPSNVDFAKLNMIFSQPGTSFQQESYPASAARPTHRES